MYFVYMLRCKDGSHYTGIAKYLSRRMRQHKERSALCAKYTKAHPIEALDGLWRAETRSDAMRLEALIKTLSKQQKLSLLQQPDDLCRIFGDKIKGASYAPVSGITLEDCLNGEIG